ncbi:MAG: AAA family ATPase [Pyrinomonadaceae bacterium]
MRLISAQVRNFKSIEDSGSVSIDPEVTVLVGQNESGKTAFLQALHKARSIEDDVAYNIEEDYPRRGMIEYKRRHKETPAIVVELSYELTKGEVNRITRAFGFELFKSLQFKVQHKYGGSSLIIFSSDEKPYIKHLVTGSGLPAEIAEKASQAKDLRSLIKQLEGEDLNTEGQNFLSKLKQWFRQNQAAIAP